MLKRYFLYDQNVRNFEEGYGYSDRLYPGAYFDFNNALDYVVFSSRLVDVFTIDDCNNVKRVVRLARYKGV